VGVLIKSRDIDWQWRRYLAAQSFAVAAAGVFEYAARCAEANGLSFEQVQRALELNRRATAIMEREWKSYVKIAPARIRTRKNAA
jgi:hypothetical protein